MIISLIGYRATGKSTVGKILAERTSLPFFDSDKVISESRGKTISEIFSADGEAGFRSIESDVVRELMTLEKGVIAWGGGVVLSESNRQQINKSEHTVWLQASAKVIFERIHGDKQSGETRPPLTKLGPMEEIEANLALRESLYRSCSDMIVITDCLEVEEIVAQISGGLASL